MPKEKRTIFYAWQSDRPGNLNRNFIEGILKDVLDDLNNDPANPFDLSLDKDTLNLSGSPDIFDSILSKIDRAAAFVGDVSIIGKVGSKKKPVSNPNVMLELGYALKSLTNERFIIVANTAFGSIEKLPFDTNGKRVLAYSLSETDTFESKSAKELRVNRQLRDAIWAILTLPQRNNEASPRDKFYAGVSLVAQQNSAALGPNGRRFISGNISTRDGFMIAQKQFSDDHKINDGIMLISAVPDQMRDYCGDGAKLATILCSGFVEQLLLLRDRGTEMPDAIAAGEQMKNAVINYLKEMAKPLTAQALRGICVSASDRNSATLLSEAFEAQDINGGIITIESRQAWGKSDISTEVGFKLDSGYIADEFANDPETGNCELDDSFVLTVDGELSNHLQLLPILELVSKANRPILVAAKGFSPDIVSLLLQNNHRGAIRSVAIRVPGSDENRLTLLKDIACLTGSKVFGTYLARDIANATLEDLGGTRKLVVTSDATMIHDGMGTPDQISIRLQQLQTRIKTSNSAYERDKLQERVSNLLGRRLVITVRAQGSTDLQDKIYLMTTAMRSVESARMWGYVTGGGVALRSAGEFLASEFISTDSTELEKEIAWAFHTVLIHPLSILLNRASFSIEQFVAESKNNNQIGFDVQKRKITNLSEANIFDSAQMLAAAVAIAFDNAKNIAQLE